MTTTVHASCENGTDEKKQAIQRKTARAAERSAAYLANQGFVTVASRAEAVTSKREKNAVVHMEMLKGEVTMAAASTVCKAEKLPRQIEMMAGISTECKVNIRTQKAV